MTRRSPGVLRTIGDVGVILFVGVAAGGLSLVFASCGSAEAAPTSPAVSVPAIAPAFEDIQRGVVCYYPSPMAFSCVKVK